LAAGVEAASLDVDQPGAAAEFGLQPCKVRFEGRTQGIRGFDDAPQVVER
jgi:hypothetical protein